MVTGAGVQLDQRFADKYKFKTKKLILYEMSELALFTIEKELSTIAYK